MLLFNRPDFSEERRESAFDELQNEITRFWSYVEKDDNGCWNWTGAKINGYGQISVYGESATHRFAYLFLVGEIPAGMTLDHLCRNRACCNPAHLEPVSNSENVRRMNEYYRISGQKKTRRKLLNTLDKM